MHMLWYGGAKKQDMQEAQDHQGNKSRNRMQCQSGMVLPERILYHAGSRVRHAEAVPLQVARVLEERVAAAEDVTSVRHWLSLIGLFRVTINCHAASIGNIKRAQQNG